MKYWLLILLAAGAAAFIHFQYPGMEKALFAGNVPASGSGGEMTNSPAASNGPSGSDDSRNSAASPPAEPSGSASNAPASGPSMLPPLAPPTAPQPVDMPVPMSTPTAH